MEGRNLFTEETISFFAVLYLCWLVLLFLNYNQEHYNLANLDICFTSSQYLQKLFNECKGTSLEKQGIHIWACIVRMLEGFSSFLGFSLHSSLFVNIYTATSQSCKPAYQSCITQRHICCCGNPDRLLKHTIVAQSHTSVKMCSL